MKLIRKTFSPEDDAELSKLVPSNGTENWTRIAQQMSRAFTARQCRDRWRNYLDPGLQHSTWTADDDQALMQEYRATGTKWVMLASRFAGRSSNAVRNRVFLLLRRGDKMSNQRSYPIPLIRRELEPKEGEESATTVQSFFSLCEPAGLCDFSPDSFSSMFFSAD
jgi:hypothetical protein